jgi:hypothetical protein
MCSNERFLIQQKTGSSVTDFTGLSAASQNLDIENDDDDW